jgi:predicted ABC-type ATPase
MSRGRVTDAPPVGIYVLAGVNGAGKSSVIGEFVAPIGGEFFNPDTVASEYRRLDTALSVNEANGQAWEDMVRLLEEAIDRRLRFAFETTLGGNTITRLLKEAVGAGIDVRILYVGLGTPELHIARVRQRVSRGGHEISDDLIRSRFSSSLDHLIELAPIVAEVHLYDNSVEVSYEGQQPDPLLVFHAIGGRVIERCSESEMPDWAIPVAGALNL